METEFDSTILVINTFSNNIDSFYTEEDCNKFKLKYNEWIQGIQLLLRVYKRAETLDFNYRSSRKHYMSYKIGTMDNILKGFREIIEECKLINSNIDILTDSYKSLNQAYFLSIEIVNLLTKSKFDYIMVHDLLSIYIMNCKRFIKEGITKLDDFYKYECITNKNRQWTCPICTEHDPQYNLVWISVTDPEKEYSKNGYTVPEKCGHKFHESCIKEWFKRNDTCPLDRNKVNFIMHYKPTTNHDD
jgi:hypothetical protein